MICFYCLNCDVETFVNKENVHFLLCLLNSDPSASIQVDRNHEVLAATSS